jgi:hypothetical protein
VWIDVLEGEDGVVNIMGDDYRRLAHLKDGYETFEVRGGF